MSTWAWRPIGRYAAGLFLLSFALALGSNVSLSLVLERSGAPGLPPLIVLHAILLAVITLGAGSFVRVRVGHWLAASLALAALLVLVAGLSELAGAGWSVGMFYLVTNVVADVAATLFWVMVNQLFDLRAAKRAFPKIGAAGTAGAALAGFSAPGMTSAVGVRGLAVVLLVTLTLAACSSLWLARAAGVDLDPRSAPRSRMRGGASREDGRLITAMVVGVLAVTAVTLFGRYLYARALDRAFAGDAASIASQNGVLSGIGSMLTTATQLWIAPAVMSRLGVRTAMVVFPMVMMAVFAATGSWFGLVTGVFALFATTVLRKGLLAPAEGILPTALSSEQTSRALLLVTAVGAPLGMALAGVALRVARDWTEQALSAAGLGLAAALLGATLWRARTYSAALHMRLKKGGSELRLRLKGTLAGVRDLRAALGEEIDPMDPGMRERLETLVVAQREADDAADGAPIHAGALSRIIEARLAEAYRLRAALDRLPHPASPPGLDELWRRAIVERIQEDVYVVLLALRASTRRAELDRVAPRLFDVDPSARGAAVELLETLCPPDLRPLVVPLVEGVGLDQGRAAAAQRFGKPNGDPVLDLLDIEGNWLRALTVYAVAAAGAERYRHRIRALQGSQDPWLELACARALSPPEQRD